MKNLVISAFVLLCLSCNPKTETDEELKIELVSMDKAFSIMAQEKGMREAFLFFVADDVIKPQADDQPLIGVVALRRSFDAKPKDESITSWTPLKADVSGNMGYTFGSWERKSKPFGGTITYGNYVTIWKRQRDKTWRVVFDTGNTTPGPVVFN